MRVRVFRHPAAGSTGPATVWEYMVRLQGRVLHGLRLRSLLSEVPVGVSDVVVLDWEPPTDPEDVRVLAMAADLYARVYAARFAAGFPIPRDSAGNARSVPESDAHQAAARAVMTWREQFYPDTVPPGRPFGGWPEGSGVT